MVAEHGSRVGKGGGCCRTRHLHSEVDAERELAPLRALGAKRPDKVGKLSRINPN